MTATVLVPFKLVCTTTLQDLTDVTPANKVRSLDVRFTNVGAASGYGDLVLTNGTIIIDRAKNYPVPYQDAGSAPDMEQKIVLPAGWKLQAKASATNTVQASATGIEADVTDFD